MPPAQPPTDALRTTGPAGWAAQAGVTAAASAAGLR